MHDNFKNILKLLATTFHPKAWGHSSVCISTQHVELKYVLQGLYNPRDFHYSNFCPCCVFRGKTLHLLWEIWRACSFFNFLKIAKLFFEPQVSFCDVQHERWAELWLFSYFSVDSVTPNNRDHRESRKRTCIKTR